MGKDLRGKTPEGFWDVVVFCFSAWVNILLLPKLYIYVSYIVHICFIYSFVFCCISQCSKCSLKADLEKVIL